ALAAAGVRNLSDAVATHVVEAHGDSSHGLVGDRLGERRMLLLRVLGDDLQAAKNLDDFLAAVTIRYLERLEIQQTLDVGPLRFESAAYARGALYLPESETLLCVESQDIGPAWVEVARE